MKPLKAFDIQFVGLKLGKHNYKFEIDYKFFEYFEYDDFNNVNVIVDINLVKKSTFLELNFQANGLVNVNCDLTNENYDEKLCACFDLVVNFGNEYNDENDEILILPHGEYEINVAHYIYELIALSLPLKRVHPGVEDGTLGSDILKKLEDLSPKCIDNNTPTEDTDPRWEKLKKLITDK
ncbi:DUF177 domain-containing protein [Flavobacteriaceae bacterium]|jgi:uncharacterized metal-binding protein YceD (DUF177 family)|nr:DUF177 domain-containing protein [Flavobacteriaceae bacterium]